VKKEYVTQIGVKSKITSCFKKSGALEQVIIRSREDGGDGGLLDVVSVDVDDDDDLLCLQGVAYDCLYLCFQQ
jgi:hypothetical protein